ncbi:MAG: TetR family transcriptional regulator [Actinobacteria bacterium]|nr:TetR family transcriptional regulator [Actinomycetota bacterium]
MPRDAAATRSRILAAAIAEFSAAGLAGARVDRIAAAADANPRSIYVHFGSKENLFAAAVDEVIRGTAERVPLTEDDLPGFAGRAFDDFVEHPETLRIALWRQLERPDLGPDFGDLYAQKLAAIAGSADPSIGPVDLVVFLYGLAQAWLLTPRDLLAADGSDPDSSERLAAHRAALVAAAGRISSRTA